MEESHILPSESRRFTCATRSISDEAGLSVAPQQLARLSYASTLGVTQTDVVPCGHKATYCPMGRVSAHDVT
jgi:hypothetical protein